MTATAVYFLIVTAALGLYFWLPLFSFSVWMVFVAIYCEGCIGFWYVYVRARPC
jgi:hypothetical protein